MICPIINIENLKREPLCTILQMLLQRPGGEVCAVLSGQFHILPLDKVRWRDRFLSNQGCQSSARLGLKFTNSDLNLIRINIYKKYQ